MRAIPLILASVLMLGTCANVSATGKSAAGASGSYNCNNQPTERTASHESATTGGDALNLPHASSTTRSDTSSSHTSSSNSSSDDSATHLSGGDASSSGSSHSSGLGWQSLLPGSIQ